MKAQVEARRRSISRGGHRGRTAPQEPQLFPPSEAAPHLGQSEPCIFACLSNLITGFGFLELFVFELIVIMIVIVLWELMKRDKRRRGRALKMRG
jgi:hypothetical protein